MKLSFEDFELVGKFPLNGMLLLDHELQISCIEKLAFKISDILKANFNWRIAKMKTVWYISTHKPDEYNFINWYIAANNQFIISAGYADLRDALSDTLKLSNFIKIKETSLNRGSFYAEQFNL